MSAQANGNGSGPAGGARTGPGVSGDPIGIDVDAVTRWFADHVDATAPPLRFDLITGGRSNLTYDVTDEADHRWVLRRPPTGMVLQSAHDVGRERRLMDALGPTPVPVPVVVGATEEDDVTGAPFFVMQRVDGHVVRTQADAERLLSEAARRTAGEQLVDVLLQLHAVEPDQVGLGDLGRGTGYIARQLKRWHGQLQAGRTRELPLLDEIHDRLAAAVPDQQATRIVHGDYRLDNVIVGDDGVVRAVLDWEICTLGDPLADLGLLLVYWSDPGEQFAPLLDAPDARRGLPHPGRPAPQVRGGQRPRPRASSTSTPRSGTGSSPRSSKASTRGTPPGCTGPTTTRGRATRSGSTASVSSRRTRPPRRGASRIERSERREHDVGTPTRRALATGVRSGSQRTGDAGHVTEGETMAELASGHLAVRALKQAGVDHLFTLSGGHIFPLYDGCRHEDVTLVDTRHEQTAAFAAEGLAKLTRRPQVAALTAGPGVTNGISAIASAQQGGSPMLVIGGRAPQATWGRGSLQELDHCAFVAPLTKHATTSSAPEKVAADVLDALRIAGTAHRGPTFVDVPLDVVFAPADEATVGGWTPPDPVPVDTDALERARDVLARARRPVIVAGTDTWLGGAHDALRELAASATIPVIGQGMGRGLVPADDPLAVSRARGTALKQADVVVVVGTPAGLPARVRILR